MGLFSAIFGGGGTSASTSTTTTSRTTNTTNNRTSVKNFQLGGGGGGNPAGIAIAGNEQGVSLNLTDAGAIQAGRDLGLMGLSAGLEQLGQATELSSNSVREALGFGSNALKLASTALTKADESFGVALAAVTEVSNAPRTDAGIAIKAAVKWLPAAGAITAIAYAWLRSK